MPSRFYRLIASLVVPFIVAIYFILNGQGQATISIPDPEPTVVTTTTTVVTAVTEATSTVAANAVVPRVVDGDTFVARLDNEPGEWKIRMLGINTPETVDPRRPVQCFGKQASAKLKSLLTERRVRLAPDPQADERDKYGRLLRNVYLTDGTDVNALMVREGYAYAYLSFPLTPARKRELKALETEARVAKRGLWAPGVCAPQ